MARLPGCILRYDADSAPTGGLCGAVFLDQDFERWMSKRLGALWTQMTRSDLKKMVNDCWV